MDGHLVFCVLRRRKRHGKRERTFSQFAAYLGLFFVVVYLFESVTTSITTLLFFKVILRLLLTCSLALSTRPPSFSFTPNSTTCNDSKHASDLKGCVSFLSLVAVRIYFLGHMQCLIQNKLLFSSWQKRVNKIKRQIF